MIKKPSIMKNWRLMLENAWYLAIPQILLWVADRAFGWDIFYSGMSFPEIFAFVGIFILGIYYMTGRELYKANQIK